MKSQSRNSNSFKKRLDDIDLPKAELTAEYLSKAREAASPKSTLLLAASEKGRYLVVESLLQHKADPLVADDKGNIPLHKAAQSGSLLSALLLLDRIQSNDRSANIASMVNGDGETPEILAAEVGAADVCRAFEVFQTMQRDAASWQLGSASPLSDHQGHGIATGDMLSLIDLAVEVPSAAAATAGALLRRSSVGTPLVPNIFQRVPEEQAELSEMVSRVCKGIETAESQLLHPRAAWDSTDPGLDPGLRSFVATASLRSQWQKIRQEALAAVPAMAAELQRGSIKPTTGIDPDWVAQFPLSTKGRSIVNQQGERFRLRSINWYGASDQNHVVGGLNVQSLETICGTVQSLGFTAVRLPFSNEMLRSSVTSGCIDFGKNPKLKGLTALEVLDEVVHCLARHRVVSILNNHTTHGEWCGGPDRNGLWFDPASSFYTEAQWLEDWAMLASRYRDCGYVVGFDLRNEVRFCPWPFRYPIWLGGGSRILRKLLGCLGFCDWADAARRCAQRLLETSPDKLLVVERRIWPMRGLRGYDTCLLPELRNRLVLGVHHYSWNGPGRYLPFAHLRRTGWQLFSRSLLRFLRIFSHQNYGEMSTGELSDVLFEQWGWLLDGDICPVWISEFGTGPAPGFDLDWFQRFVEILGRMEADYAYWPLNVGPKPGCGGDEPYGMISPDWTPKLEGDIRLNLLRLHGLLPAAGSEDKKRWDFWQTHLTAEAMANTMRQATTDTFQLLLTALWLYTREAWLRHLLDALAAAVYGIHGTHASEGDRGATGEAPVALPTEFAPVAPFVEALSPCMQLVQAALLWFEEANIRHTAVTYRPLQLPMLGLQKLVDRYVAARKAESVQESGRLDSGYWLSLGGGSFFSSLSSRSMAISRLAKTRCNVLVIIRPDETFPSYPKHMSLRGSNVDDSIFSLETLFRIGRITRTVSSELDVDGSAHFTGPRSRWPVIIIEVYSVSCFTEAPHVTPKRVTRIDVSDSGAGKPVACMI
ncbi:unnamed protein product [Symbiodinium sp. CCMP2456]|nr:unnamed protein product [Symbiodinium sp. CCMP2456]